MVDIKAEQEFPQHVTLAEIKSHPDLSGMFLVRHSRLSVGPVAAREWKIICRMAGIKA